MERSFALLLTAIAASACDRALVHAVAYYNVSQVPASTADQHYEQFADVGGGVASLGCLVVQRRQINCYDNAGNGTPNLRLAVVECACPCVEVEPDPCDPTRAAVRSGVVRGLVNQSEGAIVLGGVEIATQVDLSDAGGLFITTEPNDDPDPAPSTSLLLGGALHTDGAVLRGELVSPSSPQLRGTVTVVPVRDEVSL